MRRGRRGKSGFRGICLQARAPAGLAPAVQQGLESQPQAFLGHLSELDYYRGKLGFDESAEESALIRFDVEQALSGLSGCVSVSTTRE